MGKIDFKKQNIPFVQTAHGVLYDKKLTLGAKTVYSFMYSKPDGWDFSAERIGNELAVTKKTILKHLKELKDCGYLLSQKLPSGRMLYKVIFPPLEPESKIDTLGIEPKSKKCTVHNLHGGDFTPISNKEEESNKEEDIAEINSADIIQIIDLFKEINPSYKKWYANKTQRSACKRLIETHSLQRVLSIIPFLVKSNSTAYMPTITTPLQLEDRWASLEATWNKKRSELEIKRSKVGNVYL